MIPRIKDIRAMDGYKLYVRFDSDEAVIYNVARDIGRLKDFRALETQSGLFESFLLDESRTCVTWSDRIDLSSDTLFEFGIKLPAVLDELGTEKQLNEDIHSV